MHALRREARRTAWGGPQRVWRSPLRLVPHIHRRSIPGHEAQWCSAPAPAFNVGEPVELDGRETRPQEETTSSSLPPQESPGDVLDVEAANPVVTLQSAEDGHLSRIEPFAIPTSMEPYRPGISFAATKEKPKASYKKQKISVGHQLHVIIAYSWINSLLAFVPAGFAVNYTHRSAITIFWVNFIAIIPSAVLLAFSVDEIGLRVGDILQGLLNMTFSNAVQLVSSILLLKTRQIGVLQASLLGNILSNLLLMTGLGFFFGGLNCNEQYFNAKLAQTISMLLLLAVLGLVVPTASRFLNQTSQHGIAAQSRGTAVIIMISYALWLFFQLKTNREMFDNVGQPSSQIRGEDEIDQQPNAVPADEKKEDAPTLTMFAAVLLLVVSTTLVACNTQFATDSIHGLLKEAGLSESFVGTIILPILSLDPTSIMVAVKDKMDMSISLTLARCMQTALMVVPLTVLLAWAMDVEDMTLEFDSFSVAALFISIIIVAYVVQEGKSNWLTGALLIKVYVIIALSAFFVR